ncbi:uncharacterized protein G2W53_031697 [Senna tora]|uniref:Uncharacterized protein n=1 Tax=Senna tora TaxID=362788 RepID=A0A834SXD8_9FABA|nr:uncharacterized protein G2W53_031697 [Senna tora]
MGDNDGRSKEVGRDKDDDDGLLHSLRL